jgi:hypothetical protein
MAEGINPEETFSKAVAIAATLPTVRIDRDAYLRSALRRHCTPDQVQSAIQGTPAAAGVPAIVIENAARAAIRIETTRVSGLSALAGIPGGLAMFGTVPADTVQYFGHMIRISQKLAYLYGWPNLFSGEDNEMDDATMNVLILFLGVMVGANAASGAVNKLSQMVAQQVVRKLPQQALTKGIIYPLVKKVATQLGVEMTKQIFAKGVAKAVPILGAVVSGSLTLATYAPMCHKLKKHLANSDLAKCQVVPATDTPDV